MIFRRGGRIPSRNHDFSLNGSQVEIVPEYTYLGVKFTPTATGRAATDAAVSRTRVAAASALRLLSSIGADSWEGTKRLHSSVVSSSLLYTSSLWALRDLPTLESAHMNFFKRLFNLQRNAPGYAIRLETGITGITYEVIKQALRWIVKILKMPPDRLPRICLLRQIELASVPSVDTKKAAKYNWILQIKQTLLGLETFDLWTRLLPNWWELRIPDILSQLLAREKYNDYLRYHSSTSLLTKISRRPMDDFEVFYPNRCPIEFLRAKMQLRLFSIHTRRFTINRIDYQLDPNQLCTLCLSQSQEDMIHILFICPFYHALRVHYLPNYLNNPDIISLSCISAYLNSNNYNEVKSLFCFIQKCLQLRSLETND